jgi:hypothetical protein
MFFVVKNMFLNMFLNIFFYSQYGSVVLNICKSTLCIRF